MYGGIDKIEFCLDEQKLIIFIALLRNKILKFYEIRKL